MIIKTVYSPEQISCEWDNLADSFYMTKSFLSHIHRFNYCNQRYYELYDNDKLMCATIVYTLNINLFTFSKFQCILKMQVVGIPVSIATPPVIGDLSYTEQLMCHILKAEKGLILGLNLLDDYCRDKALNMRMLPTIVMKNNFSSIDAYKKAIRHPYRRRLVKHELQFRKVETIESECKEFAESHYSLYLEIMKRTGTKLEILSFDFFYNLPDNFILTTHYLNNEMLAWQICTTDRDTLYFFFGGMNYKYRDGYSSYYNNLLSILKYAIANNFSIINFGQTAELAKLRLGGELSERRMFIYHRNALFSCVIKLLRALIEYADRPELPRVFKQNSVNH